MKDNYRRIGDTVAAARMSWQASPHPTPAVDQVAYEICGLTTDCTDDTDGKGSFFFFLSV